MKLEELPLLDIFNSLRQRHGLLLGIDEYLVVLRSLQAGFGIGSRQEVEQLCSLMWAKSNEERLLIQRLFMQIWRQSEDCSLPPLSSQLTPNWQSEEPLPEASASEITPALIIEMDEPVQVIQAVRHSGRDRELKRPRYSLLSEYFPVTRREMKQSWRHLRRLVRQGVATELDVEATVNKMGHEGILLAPVLVPPRTNQTDLVLLIDQDGSMVPFHALSRQLAETAQRGGLLKQTWVFYFHDCADEYLYRDPAFCDAQLISEVLAEVGKQAVVLIVSDGGAARGSFDQDRVERTKVWIEQLQQSVRYCVWLNPMPNEWWQRTTAEEIARLLPMFEMSRQGMNAAISILRGRYIAWERMYSWLL